MATASILDSSNEKSNGFRLMRLIVDGGTEALRKTFTRYRPGNLNAVLCTYQPSLLRLKHRKIINQNQWDKLYPSHPGLPNINDFDITLLAILLRSACGLMPPALGWEKIPNTSDHAVEADIVRIKLFRNKRFGHVPNTSVNSTEFATFWAEISSPLVRLGIDQKEIDRLENELCGEEEVERVLKAWNKSEHEIMNVLNENRNVLNETQKALCEIKDDVKTLVKINKESRLHDVLKKHLVLFNFEREIELYQRKFTEGTRDWVFNQVLAWFNEESSPNRAFIITGLAGMGKSVIAAVICRRFAEHVGASHFFQYNNSQYNNPKFLLQSLAWHLCNAVPSYREALIDKLSGNLGQSLNDMNVKGLFSILFKEPFSVIADPGKRILVVVDALDESEYNGKDDLGSLISNHLHKLPSYIRFVVTTRPEKNLIDKFKEFNPLYIEANDARNLNDLKLVLNERISSTNAPTADFIDSLAEKCDGLMLYAFFLSEIYNDQSCKSSIDSLPEGVGEYYEICFKRLACEFTTNLEISEDVFFSFLSTLAVAQEPLPEALLEILFGFENSPRSRQRLRKAINSISSFLVINENKSVSFFHKSSRDWLVDNTEHDYSVDVPYGHQILFDLCIKKLKVLRERGVSDERHADAMQYALKYYILHMLNRQEISGKLECFVRDYVTDLEVLFASVRLNVDLTLNNVTRLMNHEMYNDVSENTRATVSLLCSLIRRFAFLLRDYPQTFLQNVVNEGGEELSLKASTLLQSRFKDIIYLELIKKDRKNDALEARLLLSGTISGIDMSPKHDYVVCSYVEGGIELFSLANGKTEWKILDFNVERPLSFQYRCQFPSMFPRCIVFHPLENLILPGRLDQVLTLQGEFTPGQFQCDEGCSKFTNCRFFLDSSRMVTYYGNNLIVWNILSGEKEKCLPCDCSLISLCFSASGNFLGTTDFQNVFNVYDIMNDYNVISMTFESQTPLDILSTYELNSWFCSVDNVLTIVNHDLTLPSRCRPCLDEMVLPFFCSEEHLCFLPNKPPWFCKVKEIGSDFFFNYLLGKKSVLIHNQYSKVMQVFSVNALVDSGKTSVSDGNSDSMHNRLTLEDTVCEICEQTIELSAPVVKGGVILMGDNLTPELWNSDMTQRLARFEQLAGTKRCFTVSDQLIACVRQSSVVFFNVVTQEIRSNTFFKEDIEYVYACSIKYHVLAWIQSSDVSLWKDGARVDGWEDILYKNTSTMNVFEAKFSPQGNLLALSPLSENVFIFDVVSLSFLAQITFHGSIMDHRYLKFFDNKNLLCSSFNHEILYFINVELGEILTCVDFGNTPDVINVCHKRNIVFSNLGRLKRPLDNVKLIKVWMPRK